MKGTVEQEWTSRADRRAYGLYGLALLLLLLALSVGRTQPTLGCGTGPAAATAFTGLDLVVTLASFPGGAEAGAASDEGGSDGGSDAITNVVRVPIRIRLFRGQGRWFSPVRETSVPYTPLIAVDDLVPGKYWVLVDAPGFARRSAKIVLVPGERRQIRLELPPAVKLEVSVRDEKGESIRQATVLVRDGDMLPFGGLTDTKGNAIFPALGDAPYRVRVSREGYDQFRRQGVRDDLKVILKRLAAIELSVVEADGKPAPGATVMIVGSALWPARSTMTNAKGEVRIGGLSSGSYDLSARTDHSISETEIGFSLSRGEVRRLVLRLGAGRLVTAMVTDGDGDNPIVVPNAEVVLVESGVSPVPQQGRTGADGTVRLGPIPKGPAILAARAEGFVGRCAVEVPEVLDVPVRLSMLRGGLLRGRIEDKYGHGIAGVTIEVIGIDLDGLPIAQSPYLMQASSHHFASALLGPSPLLPAGELGVMPGPIPVLPGSAGFRQGPLLEDEREPNAWSTDIAGRYELKTVIPGRVRILVRHPEYIEAVSDAVTLTPGGEVEINVVLRQGGLLEGRVLDSHERPVAGSRVLLTSVRGTLRLSTLTALDGTFAFAAVPNEFRLGLADPEDIASIVLEQEFEFGDQSRLELELLLPEPREDVALTLVDEHGEPIEMARVLALSLDPEVPMRRTLFTDDAGKVWLPMARGIKLRLEVDAFGFSPGVMTLDPAPEAAEVSLFAGVLVEGQVTRVRGRRAAAGATITLTTQGKRYSALADVEGRFRLQHVPAGVTSIRVNFPGDAESEGEVTIVAMDRRDRPFVIPTIDLDEAGVVIGFVLDLEGQPVAGARVATTFVSAYLSLGSLPVGMAQTDRSGSFELRGVAPGEVMLHAYGVGVGRGEAAGTVEAGDRNDEKTIELDDSAEDDGAVADATVAVTLGEGTDPDEPSELSVVVMQVAPASEAMRAGLRAGDIILSVDAVAPESIEDARSRMSGRMGTDVVVEVSRSGGVDSLRVPREQVRR